MSRKRRGKAEKGWTLDKAGKWRDERGRFLSRERLRDGLALASPEQVAGMLSRGAKKAGRSKSRVVIQAHFDGVGWRSLCNSEGGYKVALNHSASWLRNQLNEGINEYRKLDNINKKKLRRGENVEPKITDIRVVRLGPTKMERKAAKKRRKKKK